MKDVLSLHPFGRISIRTLLTFVATLVVTVFAYIFVSSPIAYAAGEAKWESGNLVYEDKIFNSFDDIKEGDGSGLPAGTKVYLYVEPGNFGQTARVQMIYFGKNENPKTAKSANYVTYMQALQPIKYSDPQGKKTIQLIPMSQAERNEETSSCIVEGIGWIICPVTNFLSKAMDWLFEAMSAFLTVRPVQTDQESALYRGWSMMRNLANVAFVIAFMIIIYSQITSIGLSSYGIKRLLPRLIAAAILVNVSYWICAIAIDLSNIAGFSVYDMFDGMRNNLVGEEGNGFEILNWQSLTGFLLSGGTAAAATGIGVYAAVAAAGGPIFMLLPILVGVVISALIALLIMAARQALITILVIIAPLAFVAYLLPNTEKFFDKWKGIFGTMLMLFPIFAAIVGGAQLAGDAIIQNANSINMIILGMAVKIAPVVITPFLLKFSGSLLGKLAGIVNNPGKGLMDRTRNFAKGRADNFTARQMANTRNPNFLARGAQSIDARKRRREGMRKAHEGRRDATWANSQAYSDIHAYDHQSHQLKEIGENHANAHTAAEQLVHGSATQSLDLRARASKLNLDVSKARVDANWEEIRTTGSRDNFSSSDLSLQALASQVRQNSIEQAVQARRTQSAEHVRLNDISQAFQNDGNLQVRAGGVDANGAQRALADALKKQHEIRGEAVKNASAIIGHMNIPDDEVVKLTRGQGITSIPHVTDEVQEAAIKAIASGKNVKALQDMLDTIDVNSLNENQRITLSDELKANGSKPKFIGASASAKIAQNGQQLGVANVDVLIKETIAAGKFSAEALATQDEATLKRVFAAIQRNPGMYDPALRNQLRTDIDKAKTDPILQNKLGERRSVLEDILNVL